MLGFRSWVVSIALASLLLLGATPAADTSPPRGEAPAAGSLSGTIAVPATPSVSVTGSIAATGTALATSVDRVSGAIVAMSVGDARVGSGVVIGPGLVLTSSQAVTTSPLVTGAILTGAGDIGSYRVLVRNDKLGLVLLGVGITDAKPVVWGDSSGLIRGTRVLALGMPTISREVIPLKGTVSSSPISFGNVFVSTDIPADPLIEGGALVLPDGRLVGIMVSQGRGLAKGDRGLAVTSQAAKAFVDSYLATQAANAAEAAGASTRLWIRRGVLAIGIILFSVLGWWFRRWYKGMEAREEARAHEEDRGEEPSAEE